ncbi:hypothetical protein [Acinetobacter baumannii]
MTGILPFEPPIGDLHEELDKKSREEFEAWAHSKKWNIFKFPNGQYVDEFVNGAWHAWQYLKAQVNELKKANLKFEIYLLEIQQNTKDANELQNRINAALARANMTCLGGPMFFRQFDDVLAILRGKEPLNHDGEETFAEFHLKWFALENADLSEEEVKKLYDRVYGHSHMQSELHNHEEIWKLQQKQVNYWKKAYKNLKLQLQNREADARIDAKRIAELENRANAALKIIEPLLVCEMYAHEALKLERALSGESNGQV